MNKEINDEIMKEELKRLGFKPREDKDLNEYIKHLRYRLAKEGKDIFWNYKSEDGSLELYIGKKEPNIAINRRNKYLQIRVNDEELERYNKLAKERGTTISELVRNYLDSQSMEEINGIMD